MADDDETLCNVARYFMKEYQFITDAYRLYSALNRLSHRPNKWYNSGPSQKYILRQIKAMDSALHGEKRKRRLNEQKASYTTKDKDGNPILPKEMDVALLMLYGHMLYFGASYAYALSTFSPSPNYLPIYLSPPHLPHSPPFSPIPQKLTRYLTHLDYFYRAHALEPRNPMITLSLALAYLHYALKRQSSNRHHLLVQGFSFLFAYYDFRKVSQIPSERQEGEFNVARAYHMLGLTHLAIPFYERVLRISEEMGEGEGGGGREGEGRDGGKGGEGGEGGEETEGRDRGNGGEDFATEAAFALQGIWAAGGEVDLAQKLTEKWLLL